ncbi:MAG: IS200/IS605 family transposase [Capsulimonadales bacterium]|nr:IS200/IS605 family transposase [Capsulimonadales bacterium]
MGRDYRKSGSRVHNLNYHIVFCPKYRRKCLVGDVAKRCEELVREKCAELEADVIALEVMPDHVHLFVAAKPDLAPSYIVNQVKGVSSRRLREEFPHLLKMPSLWTRSWYVGSVGHASDSVVQAYIENQRGK